MNSKGEEKEEKGREQQLTGEELAKRIHVENLCSIQDLLIAEADRVLCYLEMLKPCFCTGTTK